MTPLYRFLNVMYGRKFIWGECDCVLMLADWVQFLRGVDPAAEYRLTYGTAGECQRVTRFYTEPVALFDRLLAPHGIAQTAAPVAGDIGIVLLPMDGRMRPHGALCLGNKWAAKSEHGILAAMPPQVVQAWGVNYAA
jgi:hypothetical protein